MNARSVVSLFFLVSVTAMWTSSAFSYEITRESTVSNARVTSSLSYEKMPGHTLQFISDNSGQAVPNILKSFNTIKESVRKLRKDGDGHVAITSINCIKLGREDAWYYEVIIEFESKDKVSGPPISLRLLYYANGELGAVSGLNQGS